MDFTTFDKAVAELSCACLHDEPMSRHTTFCIGGTADRFVTVETQSQLTELISVLKKEQLPYFVIGRGSNLLVSDLGIRGAVLQLAGDFKPITLCDDGVTVKAGAGVSLMTLCKFALEHSLSGLEFAYGIPGSVGGAVYMNAGAYGGEMKDVVRSVTHLTADGETVTAKKTTLDFAYRHSRYTGSSDTILFAEFSLHPAEQSQIKAQMDELFTRRKEKQPYTSPSAGSIFKRPQNGFAAALIEQCGLKGKSVGGAQVSEKHSGFMINTGGATCQDVLDLIELVRQEVLRWTGTLLECEVRVTGETEGEK